MENASKAIIMAGGMLLALVIMAILVLLFNTLSDVGQEQKSSLSVEQLEEYNRQFSLYDRSLYGSELLSLANLIEDYTNKQEDVTLYPITVNIKIKRELIGVEGIQNLKPGSYLLDSPKPQPQPQPLNFREYSRQIENKLKELESQNKKNTQSYRNVKSLLTELKSMPYECVSVQYNKYGRIKEMNFEQIWDEDIYNVIHPKPRTIE